MSVVVRMEMPDWCPCVLAEDNNGWYGPCFAYNGIPERAKEFDQCVENMERPSWCPIICQLPEGHGRLIDVDSLIGVLGILGDKGGDPVVWEQMRYIAEDMHTIVPAEAGSPSPKPSDPVPIRDVYYVMTECDAKTGTVKYELRERSET